MKQQRILVLGALILSANLTTVQAQDSAFPDSSVQPLSAAAQAAERTAPLSIRAELQSQRAAIKKLGLTFNVGVTSATGKGDEILGLNRTSSPPTASDGSPAPTRHTPATRNQLASSCSWKNYLGQVRDQGQAGTCWAFSAIGALEGLKNISLRSFHDLSEQQLVDCSGAGSIRGGDDWKAMEWIVKGQRGVQTEGTYPYFSGTNPGRTQSCRYASGPVKAKGWWKVPQDNRGVSNRDTLKEWLARYGPMSTSVYVDSYFRNYRSGVFNGPYAGGSINHCVVLVGYDDSKQAWLVRNSWGRGWGDQGYIWMRYGANNIGRYTALIQ